MKVAPSIEQQQAVTEGDGPHVTRVAVPSAESVAPPPPPTPSGVATASACEEGSSASSPDVTEISRQAPIRQPFRKRRFNPM